MGLKPPLERDVQRACVEWLELWGAVVIRTNSGAMKVEGRFVKFNSAVGCSDLIVCLPDGGFCAVEVKAPGRDRTAARRRLEQQSFQSRVVRANGLAVVVRSLDELKAALAAEGYDVEGRK
jgi:hypothetical protein